MKTIHALLVDDDSQALSTLGTILEMDNYVVSTAESGRMALELLENSEEKPPAVDFMVVDLDMPNLSGIELLLEMRLRGHAVPVMVVTGGNGRDTASEPIPVPAATVVDLSGLGMPYSARRRIESGPDSHLALACRRPNSFDLLLADVRAAGSEIFYMSVLIKSFFEKHRRGDCDGLEFMRSLDQAIREGGREKPWWRSPSNAGKGSSCIRKAARPRPRRRHPSWPKAGKGGTMTSSCLVSSSPEPAMASNADAGDRAWSLETLGRVAEGVVHDFNNVLAAISGLAELMLQGVPPAGIPSPAPGAIADSRDNHDSREREFARLILQAALSGQGLVKELKSFAGKGRHEKESLDLHEVLGQGLAVARGALGGRITLASDFASVPVRIHGCRGLLQNAITPRGRRATGWASPTCCAR